MNRIYKTEGIVLSRRNFGEADKILTLLTKNYGKKFVLAKGVRKILSRRAPHLELFTHVSVVLHQTRIFDIVTEASTLTSFSFLRRKLERIGFVYIALEVTDKILVENQEAINIFLKLYEFINFLNNPQFSRSQAQIILLDYKKYLLEETGFIDKKNLLDESEIDKALQRVIEYKLKSQDVLTKIQKKI